MPHDDASDAACGCGHDHAAETGPRPPVATTPARWRPAPAMRAVALGVFQRAGQILCAPVHADGGGIIGWRPLGGAIGFGERAAEALSREIDEKTGQAITDIHPLGVLENLFEHEGAPGHEIVFAFSARFITPEIYEADALAVTQSGRPEEAKWIVLAKAHASRIRLFPEGLAGLLPE
ncbi:NUDIX domain-containing protein [Rhodobacteraceae bacterium W635]|uniref:NUDIX hydrolase n=1 Tax=Nioella halotolerans TaxID=2303578 RepID=UPI000E3D1127|nr:NUDIX domain-containing protein [Rhodobacteraceae bacterium W635]